jgi:hypothetical protein
MGKRVWNGYTCGDYGAIKKRKTHRGLATAPSTVNFRTRRPNDNCGTPSQLTACDWGDLSRICFGLGLRSCLFLLSVTITGHLGNSMVARE